MIGIAMHSARERRPDKPGQTLLTPPQTSPHLPNGNFGRLDPARKGKPKESLEISRDSAIRSSSPKVSTFYAKGSHLNAQVWKDMFGFMEAQGLVGQKLESAKFAWEGKQRHEELFCAIPYRYRNGMCHKTLLRHKFIVT